MSKDKDTTGSEPLKRYTVILGSMVIAGLKVSAIDENDAKEQANKLMEENDPREFVEKLADRGMGGVMGVIDDEGTYIGNEILENLGKMVAHISTQPTDITRKEVEGMREKLNESEDKFNPLDPETWKQ